MISDRNSMFKSDEGVENSCEFTLSIFGHTDNFPIPVLYQISYILYP